MYEVTLGYSPGLLQGFELYEFSVLCARLTPRVKSGVYEVMLGCGLGLLQGFEFYEFSVVCARPDSILLREFERIVFKVVCKRLC